MPRYLEMVLFIEGDCAGGLCEQGGGGGGKKNRKRDERAPRSMVLAATIELLFKPREIPNVTYQTEITNIAR